MTVAADKPVTRRPLYSDFARCYDLLFGAADEACLDFVQQVVPPPAALLDAGCGTGPYAEALAARGYRVVAVDREGELLRAPLGCVTERA